ncbi:MAG: hypothetical protein ABFD16_08465 [Thermoguttaceae bacterium]|jgi:hypothetical protein
MPLITEDGKRSRGKANRRAAELAIARVRRWHLRHAKLVDTESLAQQGNLLSVPGSTPTAIPTGP